VNYDIDKMPTNDNTVCGEFPSSTNDEISTTVARLRHTRDIVCANCDWVLTGINLANARPKPWFPLTTIHRQTVIAFQDAKRQGCLICTRLWAKLYSESEVIPSEDIGISHYLETTSSMSVELCKMDFSYQTKSEI